MGRDTTLGGADGFDQLRHRSFPFQEEGEEPQACGIAQGAKEAGEEFRLGETGRRGRGNREGLRSGGCSRNISHETPLSAG
jgi:hypothetical protein